MRTDFCPNNGDTLTQCNGEWEHSYGITIETLDNPGWSLVIDIRDTHLEIIKFREQSYGIGRDGSPQDNNWLSCSVKDGKFIARGGPEKLSEMIAVFLDWAG